MPTEGTGPSAGSREHGPCASCGEPIVIPKGEVWGLGDPPSHPWPLMCITSLKRRVAALAFEEKERDRWMREADLAFVRSGKLEQAEKERDAAIETAEGWIDRGQQSERDLASAREAIVMKHAGLLRLTRGGGIKCNHGFTMLEPCPRTDCADHLIRAALGEGAPPAAPPEPEWLVCKDCGKQDALKPDRMGKCASCGLNAALYRCPKRPPAPAPTEAPSEFVSLAGMWADPPQPEPSWVDRAAEEIKCLPQCRNISIHIEGCPISDPEERATIIRKHAPSTADPRKTTDTADGGSGHTARRFDSADVAPVELPGSTPGVSIPPADPRADGDAEKLIRDEAAYIKANRDRYDVADLRDFASRVRAQSTMGDQYSKALKQAHDAEDALREAERKLAEVTRERDEARMGHVCSTVVAAAVRDTWNLALAIVQTYNPNSDKAGIIAALHASRAQDESR